MRVMLRGFLISLPFMLLGAMAAHYVVQQVQAQITWSDKPVIWGLECVETKVVYKAAYCQRYEWKFR